MCPHFGARDDAMTAQSESAGRVVLLAVQEGRRRKQWVVVDVVGVVAAKVERAITMAAHRRNAAIDSSAQPDSQ